MTTLLNDLRYALRQLWKSPGFAITAVLTLALGIGANTAIFTLVHAILLKSLPVADPARLYRIGDKDDCCVNGGTMENGDYSIFSYELYLRLRDAAPEFEQLAAMQAGGSIGTARRAGSSTPAKPTNAEFVSGNYFNTLGLNGFVGRVFTASDDTPSAPPVAVMSYQAWQRDYGMDPTVIGSSFLLDSHPVTVVGISPPGFYGDRLRDTPPDFWVPLNAEPALQSQGSLLLHPDTNWLYILGRLKPGINPGNDIVALNAKLDVTLRQTLANLPPFTVDANAKADLPKAHVVLSPGGAGIANMQQQNAHGLRLLMTIAALVLLIACANIANLLLVRGTARASETSLRMALGAVRARLIRQTLTESVLLSTLGGLAGIAVAYLGSRFILSLAFPEARSLPIHATPSIPVLAFAFALSLVTGIIFGIAPAWITSHSNPAEALRGANRATRDRSSLPQKTLVILQAALSLVLLTGAGLLTRSLRNLEHQDFGIATLNRYVLHFSSDSGGYGPDRLPALYRQLDQRFSALPGVQSIGMALYSPLEGDNWGEGVFIEGRGAPGPNDHIGSSWDRVSPRYFETVGQHILRGRAFTDSDTPTSQLVAIVNQAWVKRFFPRENPIGRHFGVDGPQYASSFEIVGVVSDAKYNNPHDEIRPMFFRPLLQRNTAFKEPSNITGESRSLFINSIVLRYSSPQQNLESLIRHTLADIDPNLTVTDFRSMDAQVSGNFNQERLIARLTALFGILALILASVGLYGVTSYTVARRTSEIGIRMALGANRTSVVALVLRGAFTQVAIGLALGVAITLAAGRVLTSQAPDLLYSVKTWDPVILGSAGAILTACAFLAGFIPARRAASIEPMKALRTE